MKIGERRDKTRNKGRKRRTVEGRAGLVSVGGGSK